MDDYNDNLGIVFINGRDYFYFEFFVQRKERKKECSESKISLTHTQEKFGPISRVLQRKDKENEKMKERGNDIYQ